MYKHALQRLLSPIASFCVRIDSLLWCWISSSADDVCWQIIPSRRSYSCGWGLFLPANNEYTRSNCFWQNRSTKQVPAALPILAGNPFSVTPYICSPVFGSWRIRCLHFWAPAPENPLQGEQVVFSCIWKEDLNNVTQSWVATYFLNYAFKSSRCRRSRIQAHPRRESTMNFGGYYCWSQKWSTKKSERWARNFFQKKKRRNKSEKRWSCAHLTKFNPIQTSRYSIRKWQQIYILPTIKGYYLLGTSMSSSKEPSKIPFAPVNWKSCLGYKCIINFSTSQWMGISLCKTNDRSESRANYDLLAIQRSYQIWSFFYF